ncbi:hypothetical protein SARC_00100 [Sphaeroforma arctica JP610]|uniref:Uncharacterized protein n=1 Tax=Sphaeroforma arctica JP610 TaxID=667725 RepID=A0A0L0GHM0_9EUKA|nr:hypothetical protein SARC_00100 [Sphaeroforma arctica JP610]KNC87843.1 hypothetical protein SARC_00100 [Sphaeroforma arctica JP610]|eukprot:XP_014161745.1 hypothetical protein SARC_00100 [Sphaeroforma arctica JP610]
MSTLARYAVMHHPRLWRFALAELVYPRDRESLVPTELVYPHNLESFAPLDDTTSQLLGRIPQFLEQEPRFVPIRLVVQCGPKWRAGLLVVSAADATIEILVPTSGELPFSEETVADALYDILPLEIGDFNIVLVTVPPFASRNALAYITFYYQLRYVEELLLSPNEATRALEDVGRKGLSVFRAALDRFKAVYKKPPVPGTEVVNVGDSPPLPQVVSDDWRPAPGSVFLQMPHVVAVQHGLQAILPGTYNQLNFTALTAETYASSWATTRWRDVIGRLYPSACASVSTLELFYNTNTRRLSNWGGMLRLVRACNAQDGVRYIFIIMHLHKPGDWDHANTLILDKRTGKIERFEPHGCNNRVLQQELDDQLSAYVAKRLSHLGFWYVPLHLSCPTTGPQLRNPRDEGFCNAWTMLFLHIRVAFPDLAMGEIHDYFASISHRQLQRTITAYAGAINEFAEAYETYLVPGARVVSGRDPRLVRVIASTVSEDRVLITYGENQERTKNMDVRWLMLLDIPAELMVRGRLGTILPDMYADFMAMAASGHGRRERKRDRNYGDYASENDDSD